jgi:hypothetical protein
VATSNLKQDKNFWMTSTAWCITVGILANRQIETSSSCPACYDGFEDIKHLMFTCNRFEMWQRLGIWRKKETILNSDRSDSVIVADLIKMSRLLEKRNHVGLAELILTESWYILGNTEYSTAGACSSLDCHSSY